MGGTMEMGTMEMRTMEMMIVTVSESYSSSISFLLTIQRRDAWAPRRSVGA